MLIWQTLLMALTKADLSSRYHPVSGTENKVIFVCKGWEFMFPRRLIKQSCRSRLWFMWGKFIRANCVSWPTHRSCQTT